jgi:dihydrofolate synthase/folylpolyglutamate synthase
VSDFRERIVIGNSYIPKQKLVDWVEKINQVIKQKNLSPLSFFEFTVAIAMCYFAEEKVDCVVLEVGIGGRLDPTNIIIPLVSVITNIALEHTHKLGKTLEEIAFEKAGIIKSSRAVICGSHQKEAQMVIQKVARRKNSPLFQIGKDFQIDVHEVSLEGSVFSLKTPSTTYHKLKVNLLGRHQTLNAACAVMAIELVTQAGFQIKETDIRKGLLEAHLPGRLEICSTKPFIILDGAHNPAAIKSLKANLDRFFPGKKIVLVFGVLEDKNVVGMVREIERKAKTVIVCPPPDARALDGRKVCAIFQRFRQKAYCEPSVSKIATGLKMMSGSEIICITGSFYVVGEFRNVLKLGGQNVNQSF